MGTRDAITEEQVDGRAALAVKNAAGRLLIAAGVGARLASCLDRHSGHDYVWL